jgi:hypothetical protein
MSRPSNPPNSSRLARKSARQPKPDRNRLELIVSDAIIGLQSDHNITDSQYIIRKLATDNKEMKSCFGFLRLWTPRRFNNSSDPKRQPLICMGRERAALLI